MAQQEAQDAAARKRIITHMNEDHHDSVVLYLQHYCNVSMWSASSGILTDVDLDKLSIACNGKDYRIQFDPPLKSYRETRERVVELDKTCREALSRSDITVNEFFPPTGLYLLEFLLSASTFIGYSQRWWFAHEGVVDRTLGAGFAKFSWTIQPWIISAMLLIHGVELVFFIPRLLIKHNANPRTPTWWLWLVFSFVEGQPSWWRFKKHVSKKQEEKQKQRH